MSRKIKKNSIDFEKNIMEKVKSNEISMKPKWYFFLGSILTFVGLIFSTVTTIFLTNLTFFSLRSNGHFAQYRVQMIISNFPFWIPILAIFGIVVGIYLLKKYDFTYKNNFWLIIFGFILSIFISAMIIDSLGFNESWSKKKHMKRFYRQIERQKMLENMPEQNENFMK